MLKKYEKDKGLLFDDLVKGGYTLVEKPRFESIDFIKKEIYNDDIQGDIIECGVWKGGMAIYLAYQFPDRVLWAADSYKGFQPLDVANYEYKNERHTENFDTKYNHPFSISISLSYVKDVFEKFDVVGDNIKFLEGWVKDTLDPETTDVQEIAVLRVDVDAYSATLEVLEALYDKVAAGGYIIFDDSALIECQDAIQEFKRKRGINFLLTYPSGKVGNNLGENGGFFKKMG